MKKLIFILLMVLASVGVHAQWTAPNGTEIKWLPAESSVDWETFTFHNDGEEDDYKLVLVQYGLYNDGNCVNQFTPSADNEDEFYVYFPSDNLLAHQGTLDGSFGYTTSQSPDGLTLTLTNQRDLTRKTADKSYRGWIKLLYFGAVIESDGAHVYLFTVDDKNTYRILEAVEVTD